MTSEIALLAGTAATLGLVHTIIGPDHYIPFIALSKARNWGTGKTSLITFLCGIGHILSSILLGFAGIALGTAIFSLEAIESFRGEIAVWFLIIFGFTYGVWGLHRALRAHRHEHVHAHENGEVHIHTHSHISEHTHVHAGKSVTPWVLFIIFAFGPCEPLIPLIMYPAAQHDMGAVAMVAGIFGVVTIATMLGMVLAAYYGLKKISLPGMERYSHALAGGAIMVCGLAVKFLGL